MHYALGKEYPIETEAQVKTAMQFFDKYLTRFEPSDRVKVACNIDSRVNDLKMVVDSSWVTNYSRMSKVAAGISPDFEANLYTRKMASERSSLTVDVDGVTLSASDLLDKIAQLKNDGASPAVLIDTIDEFDKVANLVHHYDSLIVDPVMTVFGSLNTPEYDSTKIAAEFTDYDIIRLSRDSEVVSRVQHGFGEKVASDFKARPLNTVLSIGSLELPAFIDTLRG